MANGMKESGSGKGGAVMMPKAAVIVLGLAALVLAGCENTLTDAIGGTLQVEKPTFSLDPGSYSEDIEVRISTGTEDASIYYTTDASDPTDRKSVV